MAELSIAIADDNRQTLNLLAKFWKRGWDPCSWEGGSLKKLSNGLIKSVRDPGCRMAAAGQHGEALRGGIRGGLEQCVPDRGGLKGAGGAGASA